MDVETVNKLLEINRSFYSRFSDDFSDSRSSAHLNIEPFRQCLSNNIRLLDVGCGNGRLAGALDRAGLILDYVGIDGSAELISLAGTQNQHLHFRPEFHAADLTVPGWSDSVRRLVPFDIVMMLAVLHHIPSDDLRSQIVNEISSLLKPGGIFIMSNWQFTRSDRLRKKIVHWSHVGLDPAQLDKNDYLLDWKRGGTGYRYVHLITEPEVGALAEVAHFNILTQFYADNDLNLYSILQR